MKKILLVSAMMAGALLSTYGQGAITYGNQFGATFISPIYGPDPTTPTLSVSGNNTVGKPSGTAVYNGALLRGTSYSLAFLAGASASSLEVITTTTFRTSATAGTLPDGLLVPATVTVPGVQPGVNCFFEMAAWDNLGGTVTTWAAAQAAWQAGTLAAGTSGVVQSGALGGVDPVTGNPDATPNTTGFTSFNIYTVVVPEPASMALFGLGAAALLIFRRRS